MHTAPIHHHHHHLLRYLLFCSCQPFLIMDFSQANHNHKQPKRKQRFTEQQVRLLERSFVVNKRLDIERKSQLAEELNVHPRQIAIWYQNRRARWKTQTLELDHSSLQLRLDSALEEKERLQKDVEFLGGELRRAQDLILLLNNRKNNPSSSSSSSPFSVASNFNNGSCGIYEDVAVNCCWVDDEDATMRGDDPYACFRFLLMNGSSGSSMD